MRACLFLCVLCTSSVCKRVFAKLCICPFVCVWHSCHWAGSVCVSKPVGPFPLDPPGVCSWTRASAFVPLSGTRTCQCITSTHAGLSVHPFVGHTACVPVPTCVNGHSSPGTWGAFIHGSLSGVGPSPARRPAAPDWPGLSQSPPPARPGCPVPLPCHQSHPSQQATRLPPLLAKFGSLCSVASQIPGHMGGCI